MISRIVSLISNSEEFVWSVITCGVEITQVPSFSYNIAYILDVRLNCYHVVFRISIFLKMIIRANHQPNQQNHFFVLDLPIPQ